MTKIVLETISKLQEWVYPISIVDSFEENDQLKILNQVIFGNSDYNCKDISLMKDLYEKRKVMRWT